MTAGTEGTATPEQAPDPLAKVRAAVLAEVRDAASCESDDGDECGKCNRHTDAILAAVAADDPREPKRSRSLSSALQRLTQAHQERGDVLTEMFAHWEYIGTTRDDDALIADWRKRARMESK